MTVFDYFPGTGNSCHKYYTSRADHLRHKLLKHVRAHTHTRSEAGTKTHTYIHVYTSIIHV